MNIVIRVNDNITLESAHAVAEQILKAENNESVENIVLWIVSSGGKIGAIPIVSEAIEMCSKTIYAIGMVRVASTAAAIFMMADKRILAPETEFVLHKASAYLQGDYTSDALENIRKGLGKSTRLLWTPVINNSSLSMPVLGKMCKNRDWILTDEELLKYGIITQNYSREEVKKLLS